MKANEHEALELTDFVWPNARGLEHFMHSREREAPSQNDRYVPLHSCRILTGSIRSMTSLRSFCAPSVNGRSRGSPDLCIINKALLPQSCRIMAQTGFREPQMALP